MKNPSINSPVADNIERVMRETGIKQCVIAQRSEISVQAFSDMLNGRRVLKINEVPKIANALSVDISELFQFTPAPTAH